MLLKWLKASEATQVGTALADDVILQTAPGVTRNKDVKSGQERDLQKFLQKFLQRVDRDAGPLQLNVFKRAKLANSFKWRLLEKGVEREVVDELTQALVLRLTANQGSPQAGGNSVAIPSGRSVARNAQGLLSEGAGHLARGAYSEALECYQQLVNFDPRNALGDSGDVFAWTSHSSPSLRNCPPIFILRMRPPGFDPPVMLQCPKKKGYTISEQSLQDGSVKLQIVEGT